MATIFGSSVSAVPVSAGLLSFLFGANKPDVYIKNTDEATLLTAASNTSQPGATGGAVLSIANNALVPVNGPLGSPSDDGEERAPEDQVAIHVVQEGETISEIAELYGVSVNTIRWANEIKKNDVINIGQELTILPTDGIKYVVEEGDTLSLIAETYDVRISDILDYNIMEPDELSIGQEIIIPGAELSDHSSLASSAISAPSVSSSRSSGFVIPLKGTITQGRHGRNGDSIDIAAPHGTPVVAACSGKSLIARVGWNGGHGTWLVQDCDNGRQLSYSHFSSLAVGPGERINAGQIVGYVGSTGRSTGNHLHFSGAPEIYGY